MKTITAFVLLSVATLAGADQGQPCGSFEFDGRTNSNWRSVDITTSFSFNASTCNLTCAPEMIAYLQILRLTDSKGRYRTGTEYEGYCMHPNTGWAIDSKRFGYYGSVGGPKEFDENVHKGSSSSAAVMRDSPTALQDSIYEGVDIPVCMDEGGTCKNGLFGFLRWVYLTKGDVAAEPLHAIGEPASADAANQGFDAWKACGVHHEALPEFVDKSGTGSGFQFDATSAYFSALDATVSARHTEYLNRMRLMQIGGPAAIFEQLREDSLDGVEPFNSFAYQWAVSAAPGTLPFYAVETAPPDRSTFLALLALRKIDAVSYRALPASFRIDVMVDALRHATFFNAWGVPDDGWQDAGEALIAEGPAARKALRKLARNKHPAPVFGSSGTELSRARGYRVCDYALAFARAIRGDYTPLPKDARSRDALLKFAF